MVEPVGAVVRVYVQDFLSFPSSSIPFLSPSLSLPILLRGGFRSAQRRKADHPSILGSSNEDERRFLWPPSSSRGKNWTWRDSSRSKNARRHCRVWSCFSRPSQPRSNKAQFYHSSLPSIIRLIAGNWRIPRLLDSWISGTRFLYLLSPFTFLFFYFFLTVRHCRRENMPLLWWRDEGDKSGGFLSFFFD